MAWRPLSLCLGLALLAEPALAQVDPAPPGGGAGPSGPLPPILKGARPGDGRLSCPEILAESQARLRELEILEKAQEQVRVDPSARTQAITAAMQALGLVAGALPLPLPLGQAAGTAIATAQMQSYTRESQAAYGPLEAQFDFALERMDLMNLLYQRRCLGQRR